MRPRKFLLITKALTTVGLIAACKKEDMPPPPGNPKGMPANPKGSTYDQPPPSATMSATPPPSATPSATPSAALVTPPPPPLPGNPKGTTYDAGKKK